MQDFSDFLAHPPTPVSPTKRSNKVPKAEGTIGRLLCNFQGHFKVNIVKWKNIHERLLQTVTLVTHRLLLVLVWAVGKRSQ